MTALHPPRLAVALAVAVVVVLGIVATEGLARADDVAERVLDVRVRRLAGPVETLRALLPDAPANRFVRLAKTQVVDLLQAARAQRLAVEASPRVSVVDGREGSIELYTSHSYVSGYAVRRHRDGVVVDPTVDIWRDGWTVTVTPELTRDGRHVTLAGRYVVEGARQPVAIETQDVEGVTGPLRVEKPVFIVSSGRFDTTVPLGAYGAVAHLPDPRSAERGVVLLFDVSTVPSPASDASGEESLLSVDVRLLEIDPDHAMDLRGKGALAALHPLRPVADVVVEAILGAPQDIVRTVTAPRLTVAGGQEANLEVLHETRYVRDYEVKTTPTGETIASPVVDLVKDGFLLDLTVSDTPKGVALEATARIADLERPVETRTIERGGRRLEVGVPAVHVVRQHGAVVLPAGHWAVLGPIGEAYGRERYVLLRPDRVPLPR